MKRALHIQIANQNLRLEVDEHKQTESILQKQAEELIALNTLGRTISATLSLEHLCAAEGRPVFSTDILSDFRRIGKACKNAGFRSFAAVPIRSNDGTMGVVGIASKSVQDFKKRSAFLEILSNQVAVSLNNARLYESLQQELKHRKSTEKAMDQILTPGSMKTALDAFENEMALETGGTADTGGVCFRSRYIQGNDLE